MSEKRVNSNPITKPTGLGSKKTKTSDTASSVESDAEPSKGFYFELPEDATQLDELRAMYDAAESVSDDPEKSLPLLRGIIHECDLAVRMHHESVNSRKDDIMALDCVFWVLYGDALLLLGQVECRDNEDMDLCEFVLEALHRYDQALTCDPKSSLGVVKKAIASAMLFAFDVNHLLNNDVMSMAFQQANDDDLIMLIDGLIELAKEVEDNHRVIELLSVVRERVEMPTRLSMSLSVLRCANMLTEALLEMVVDDERDGDEKELKIINEYLSNCINNCNKVEGDECGIILGEAYMLHGSTMELLEMNDAAEVQYQLAVESFKKAQNANVELSEGILNFLSEHY